MDDLISKQMAKDVVANMEAVGHFPYVTIDKLDTLIALDKLPSSERRAQWIRKGSDDNSCSLCGWNVWVNTGNYCPNCGAKMESNLNNSFHVGQYVLYHNKDKYELGRVVSLKQNCAFICYNEGETAAATSYNSIYPIENEYTIKTTTLGGDRFTEEEGN